jgi:sulfate adenylyltransferase
VKQATTDSSGTARHGLIAPHGGVLVNLLADAARRAELQGHSRDWLSWDLSARQLCDLELLLTGAFSPLRGFMSQSEYASVCDAMRLPDGSLWPIPITLDVTEEFAAQAKAARSIALRDDEGVMLAVLHVEDVWKPNRLEEVEKVYGTANREHPGVAAILDRSYPWLIGGRLEGLVLPTHYDFRELRLTPAEVRAAFAESGWTRVVAFQTRNPMHRAHQELTLRAARETDARLLIQPVVGMTKPGDVDHYTRVRCYQAILSRYDAGTARLALLPLAMRMAGPREAVWHAIIRKNYGCTHLIVGRDHAGPGVDSSKRPFYGPYDAQELLRRHEDELGISMVPFREMLYVAKEDRYYPEDQLPAGAVVSNVSGTELRRRLATGGAIPEWFSYPEIIAHLRSTHPPRARQGVTVFFTGLSGAGKSTIANVLRIRLLELGGRPVTLLDGDLVRKYLSSELGFSKEHRDTNIRRIGFVAAEITKCGGAAICAPIAPYHATRLEVRNLIEPLGGFLLVHVATPLEVCEQRDRKGLYAKARAGVIPVFTGISDPYEAPENADITIDTTRVTAEAAADSIVRELVSRGYLPDESRR